MKKYIGLFFAGLMMSSCVDTIIVPYDKTVEEDYWQSKSDVSQMVNGTYQKMLSTAFIQRLITWGSFRSDELTVPSTLSAASTDAGRMGLSQLESGNIETTNTFSDWSSFYSVINNCNVVLEKAGNVMANDPDYTEGDYKADCSQMLALRSLCYFYLVRAFRDVPYSSEAFMMSSQVMDIPQVAPSTVIDNCIKDLEEALPNALSATAFTDWRNKGYMNRDGICALLADIYLWRASVYHSDADYQKCIDYCDQVIASKKAQNISQNQGDAALAGYPLVEGKRAFNEIFVYKNSDEAIFELQFDENNNSNEGICNCFEMYSNKSKADDKNPDGYMGATTIYGTVSPTNVYTNKYDYRMVDNRFQPAANSTADFYGVRKFVVANPVSRKADDPSTGGFSFVKRDYAHYNQNFVIYRLTDVMLMKAEALAQLAPADASEDASDEEKADVKSRQESYLHDAFRLVQVVNNRSLYNYQDSLTWAKTTQTKTGLEQLVMQERQRELAFEGKRWFDLLRYNYRHIQGVDYTQTLYNLNTNGQGLVENSNEFLDILRNVSSKAVMASKAKNEAYLYLPVLEGQMKINFNLHQNPVYQSKGFVKN